MPQYRYTGEHPRILTGLSVGTAGVAHTPAEGNPELADGQTVVVTAGDLVDLPGEFTAPDLEPLEAPEPEPAAPRGRRKAADPDPAPVAGDTDTPDTEGTAE